MQDIQSAFAQAFGLMRSGDGDLYEIVALSLSVTGSAVVIACLIGLPLGAALAISRFPGRQALSVLVSAMMGLPPVVVGLTLYLVLSRGGPLGPLGLLYTPTAIIIAQVVLVTPIVATLSRQVIEDLDRDYAEMLSALRASWFDRVGTLLWDARSALMTAALAGMGRALAEVGAVMIVGGNIAHSTRVMTTAIALETSRGDLALALALGLILLVMSLAVNAAVMGARGRGIGGLVHG